MDFNSFEYGVFFVGVLALYWLSPHRARIPILLGASYVFYSTLDWRFLGLLLVSTAIDYRVAIAISERSLARSRQLLLLISISANLTILGFFKYFNFFLDNISDALTALGLDAPDVALAIIVPVGLSFYTFQSMSYTIDVYRREVEVERSLLVVATYVSFFPQLLAGPIERASALMPQFRAGPKRLHSADVREGLDLILLGLFKKVAVADVLAVLVADAFSRERVLFDDLFVVSDVDSWVVLAMGAYGFALQLYLDFSGYSDIARGTAKLLGIDLSRNFLRPFWSTNYTEVWRRWHVTAMAWFRDYVFLPMGGSRRGETRTAINLLVVFTLTGIWHAPVNLGLWWGPITGLILVGERTYRRRHAPAASATVGAKVGPKPKRTDAEDLAATLGNAGRATTAPRTAKSLAKTVYTVTVFTLVLTMFQLQSFEDLKLYFGDLFTLQSGPVTGAQVLTLVWGVAMTYAMDRYQRWLDAREDLRRGLDPLDVTPRQLARIRAQTRNWTLHVRDALMISAIIVFAAGPSGQSTFYYFRF